VNWNDEDLDLALRELRDEELPGAALTQVRARVLGQVRPRRATWWRWSWVPALAAGLAVVTFVPRQQPPVEPPPLIAKAPAAQPLIRPAPRRAKPVPPIPETQFARILTDDPNVVILWALNSEGESR
jgi:hypothetical protein